ncbi:MAG: NB-ARC domain-containing protein, partial [Sphaerospermopsis kisseleviana]
MSSSEGERSKLNPTSYIIDQRRPDAIYWHGRENEVAKIQEWLNLPNIKLIGVTAAGGFGKSTLVGKIFDDLQNFDQKIWTS